MRRFALVAAAALLAACGQTTGGPGPVATPGAQPASLMVAHGAPQGGIPKDRTLRVHEVVPPVEPVERDDDLVFRPVDAGLRQANFGPPGSADDPYAHPGITVLRDGPGISAVPCSAFQNGWDCHLFNQQRALRAAEAYGPPRRAWEQGFQPFQSTVPERRPFESDIAPMR